MTCIYNPDNQTKALLKHYEHVLGSYEAAYYVISLNNGYGLEYTPDGKPSLLYTDLKATHGEDAAIRMKAMTYTQPFYDLYGNWTMGLGDPVILDQNGEPKTRLVDGGLDVKMQDIMNNYFLRDDLNDELNVQNYLTDPTNPEEESVALLKILNTSYDTYVKQEVKKATDRTPEGLRKARRNASHEWYKRKVKQIIQEQQIALASAFGLEFVTNNDGSIELRGLEDYKEGGVLTTKLLRIKFVQNLNYDPLEDERRAILGDTRLDENFLEIDVNHDMYVADAVIDSIHEDMFTAKNGLIYISLNNGSAATINKVLAYHYIMSYYDSDLVQSALETIEPAANNKSQMYRVSKLIEYLTGVGNKDVQGTSILDKTYANNKDITNDQIKQAQFFNKFWSEFDELNNQVINKGVRSTEARRKILSTLAAAIMVNSKETNRTGQLLLIDLRIPRDFYFRYMPSSKEKLRLQLNKYLAFLNDIKQAYENRKTRAEKLTEDLINKNAIANMLMALQDLKSYSYTNMHDIEKTITTFLENALEEIRDAKIELENINSDIYDNNAELVNNIAKKVSTTYSDVIGFYKHLVQEISDIIRTTDALNTTDINRLHTAVSRDLNILDGIYREKLSDTAYRVVDLYIDLYWGDDIVSPAEKLNMKANAHAYLKNLAMNGDVATYETIITMNHLSRSSVAKVVFNAIQRLNRKRDNLMRKKAAELSILLNKTKKDLLKSGALQTALLGNNFQRVFQELDENGIPTGQFVRPLNYGKFYKLRTAEITRIVSDIQKEIRDELGDITFALELDNHGHPIFPEDEFFDKYWKKYLLELNHFDCTHANKMYTEEYYQIRLNMLSRKTIKAQNDILDKIDIILSPVMLEDVPHPERLLRDDLIELLRLLIQQETLSSRYDIFGHLKSGDDLDIANELLAFREAVKDGREFKPNLAKYDEATKNMSPAEKAAFDAFMQSEQIQPEYWDMYNTLKEEYRSQFPSLFDATFARMDEINKEKREIMSYFQGRNYYDVNIENMSDDAFARIRDLDIEYSNLSADLKNYLSTLLNPIPSPFEEIGDSDLLFTRTATGVRGITKFQKFIEDAQEKDKLESLLNGVITHDNYYNAIALYTVEYIDYNGQVLRRPTSAFSYFKPKNRIKDSILNRFGVDPMLLIKATPNKSFNELVGGKYKNPNYDSSNPERLQPIEKNPQYDYIQNSLPLRELYYALLDTMSEANSMVPSARNSSMFRLPQIGASTMTVWSRNKAYNPVPAVSYMLDRNFNVNESDTEINDDFYTLPDGTRINNVPQRYIQMLKNPANITADVVGSVIAYYDMAVNFDIKNLAAPTLELLLQLVGLNSTANGVNFSGRETSQYSKIENIMKSRLYDSENVSFTNNRQRLSTGKKRIFKTLKFASKWAIRSALSRNFISYITGFFDALSRLWSGAITGDLYNVRNFLKGLGLVMYYIGDGHFIGNVASYLPNNLITALMWRNGLSTGSTESFTGTHKSRFRRSMKEVKTGMAGFRISDFIINGILTGSVYDNMHYYKSTDDESIEDGTFLSDREWINRYLREHPDKTMSEAEHAYNKADTFLKAFDKHRIGIPIYGEIRELTLKPKYKVSKTELERLDADMSTILHTYAAKCNGAVFDEDKAASHQNPFLKSLSSLRNYLINDFQTRWATGDDFLDQDTSIQNINMLKAELKGKKKALSEMTRTLKNAGKKEYADAIKEIDLKILDIENKINKTANDSVMFNPEYCKEAAKAMFMGLPVGAAVGSKLALTASILFSTSGSIIFGGATILGGLSAAAISLYNNATKPNSIIINRKLSLMDQRTALLYMKSSLEGGPDGEQLRQEIDQLNKRIAELLKLNKIHKGFANWSLRQKALGYNRAMGSALTTMIDKLKFFYRTHFVESWKDLPSVDLEKMKPRLTPQEKTGLRRALGDISNVLLFTIIATVLYGFKMDDPDLVLPAKITDSVIGTVLNDDRITRDALRKMYDAGDTALVSIYSTLLENEPVLNTALWLYDAFQNHNIIPFDDDVFERMIEQKLETVLGKKAAVRSKTGEVYYKNIAASRQFTESTKSYVALQSLRIWSELIQPYDPTSVNDYLSTPSAETNMLIKEADAGIHLAQDEFEGRADKLTQRGAYTSFKKKQYYEAKSILRVTGIPTLHEETTPEGLDARFGYTRGLGIGPLIFQKPEQKSKSNTIKPKKSNRTLRR